MAEHSNKLEPSAGQPEPERMTPELYEDLLNRYERILVYAGQLQEKARRGRLLEERSQSLSKENDRLKALVNLDQAYIRLLERALESLDILKAGDEAANERKLDS